MKRLQKRDTESYYIPISGPLPVKPNSKIILDVDCGPDDAHAIILFHYLQKILNKQNQQNSQNIELLGITTVNGNTDVQNVGINTGITLELLKDIDKSLVGLVDAVKVFRGTSTPILMQDKKDYLFENDGFSGFQSYYRNIYKDYGKYIQKQHAVDFIVNQIMEYPDQVSIICVGPLTNLALAILHKPEIASLVQNVYIMGGTCEAKGNTRDLANEFNARMDPEAFYIVLQKIQNCVIMPAELLWSIQGQFSGDKIFEGNNKLGTFFNHIYRSEKQKFGTLDLCDPVMIGIALLPQITTKYFWKYIDVEVKGEHTRGMLVVDWRRLTHKNPNVYLIDQIDVESIHQYLVHLIQWDDQVTLSFNNDEQLAQLQSNI